MSYVFYICLNYHVERAADIKNYLIDVGNEWGIRGAMGGLNRCNAAQFNKEVSFWLILGLQCSVEFVLI